MPVDAPHEPDAPAARAQCRSRLEFVLPVDTVIRAIGQQPRVEFLEWIEGMQLKNGRPVVDPATGQTANPKFFAGGDVLNGGGTVVGR
jgi:glutamate synthase (NADPH/NADH) small chain